jgi:hypothetical protein
MPAVSMQRSSLLMIYMKRIVSACLLMMLLFPLFVMGQKCQIKIEGEVKEPSCQGGMDASVKLHVSGGTSPYTYLWHSGHEGASISSLTAGTYRVTVRDAEGCQADASFTLKAQKKGLGLQVRQQPAADGKVLDVVFVGNKKPAAIYIKDMSKGLRAPQMAYKGQALSSGIYLLEAFTDAGCSVSERVKIEAN